MNPRSYSTVPRTLRARPDERRAWTVLVVFAALAGFLVGRFG
jgi:hypothetical protein